MNAKGSVETITILLTVLMLVESTVAEEAPATAPAPMEVKDGKSAFMDAGSKYVSLSYGYVMTDYEDVTTDVDGWRINATYEMNPNGGKLLHGTTIGYMETSAERTGVQTVEYEVKSIPIYYAPKLVIGKKAIKGFAKGALGCHFSDYSRSGTADSSSYDDFGFYGGGSVGAMVVLKDKLFLNAEYEWVYMSNSYFRDGAVQSAMFGIGLKL